MAVPVVIAALASAAALQTPLPTERLVVQGLTRTVRFYKPARLADPPALAIALHGSGGDGERFRQFTNRAFERIADEHGFLVAYPDALGGQWNDCRARAPYRPALAGVDDVAFLKEVVRRGGEIAAGTLRGVFAVGYSNGGHLVFRLAAEAPGAFAAFAAIGAHMPVDAEFDCTAPRAPVSILLVSGTDDPINPWAGGEVALPSGGTLGTVRSGEATAQFFRQLAGITREGSVERHADRDPSDGSTAELRRWSGARAEVAILVVHGGGHTLPLPDGAFPHAIVGRTNRDVDGARVIWEFFSRRVSS